MEFNAKRNNDLASWPTFSSKYWMQLEDRMKSDDGVGLHFEGSSSKGFSQDLHHFDQFPFIDEMLSNSKLGVSTPFCDPFDHFTNEILTDIDNIKSNLFMEECDNKAIDKCPDMDLFNSFQMIQSKLIGGDQSPLVPTFQNSESGKFGLTARISNMTSSTATMNMQLQKPEKNHKKSSRATRYWTNEENRELVGLVEMLGERKWTHIAQLMKERTGKQCRERWLNHLRPNIKKEKWSEEDDNILIQAHAEVGNKWAKIAKRLPERTENSIKNHWYSTKRRLFSRSRCRPPKCSNSSNILMNYINSLKSKQSASDNSKNTIIKSNKLIVFPQPETTYINEEPIANSCLDTNTFPETSSSWSFKY